MALSAVVTIPLLPAPAAAQTYWVPAAGKVEVHGHGYGHGRGMSQHGAERAGRSGRSYRQILGFYYPRTRSAEVGGPLRVLLTADTSPDVTVRPTRRLRVRDLADGASWRLPTKSRHARMWRIVPTKGHAATSSVQFHDRSGWHRWNLPGRRSVLRGDGQFVAKGPIRLVLPGGSVTRYRGVLRSASSYPGSTTRDTVNVVSLDQYVRGVLPAEMPASWTLAALRAQAVAARTYAAWSRRAAGDRYWQVCDTTSCQVYGGFSAETDRTNAVVESTAAKVLLYKGRPALTQFSSSSGGWTSNGGKRYLPAKADRWDDWSGNGYHDWRRRVGVRFFEDRYPELGRLDSLKVTKREGHGAWGGRALQVVLRGSQGTVLLSGDDVRWALGLPSTWFRLDLTPIQRAWQRLGGVRSTLGRPTTPEREVTSTSGLDGVARRFARGRMYWSQRTSAHAVYGRVLKAYLEQGGVGSRLGFATTNAQHTADDRGRRAFFQRGMVIWSQRTGARTLGGSILKAYGKHGYAAGRLGYPTTSIFDVARGRRTKFQHGSITWIRATHRVKVHVRG